jgi:hypothetical protein
VRRGKRPASRVALQEREAEVRVGIETDRSLWVTALVAAGYAVFGINPLQVARHRGRHAVSSAKGDTADAHWRI